MIFYHPFTLSQYLSLSGRWASCKQEMVTSLCLLVGELRSLTFSVNIERYIVFSVILLFLWHLFLPISYLLTYLALFFPVFYWLCLSSSSVCSIPLSIFCRLVWWSWIPLVSFIVEGFVSSSIMKDSFSE
jgi:hypothetical protein